MSDLLPSDLDPSTHGLDPIVPDEGLFEVPQAEAWQVNDEGAAEWAMRRCAAVEQQRVDTKLRAAEWRAQIDSWEQHALKPLDRAFAFFESKLKTYQLRRRVGNPERKTLMLPSGVVRSRPSTSELVVTPEVLERWRTKRPDLVRVTVDPAIKAIRAAFVEKDDHLVDPESGEIVEGVTVIPAPEPFTVTVAPGLFE